MSTGRRSPEVRVGEPGFLAESLAADLLSESRAAHARGRPFTLAIPGGSVASLCFPRLASLALDWTRVELFWVDERAVPPADPDSNYALAWTLWLGPAGVPEERIHRMPGDAADLSHAARAYASELAAITGTPPRLDYALLGIGPDGHVASLFPGHPALREPGPVLAIEDAPKPPSRRLTLSLSVLGDAERAAFVATGRGKADVIRDAIEDDRSSLPVARVARGARRCLFLLDPGAASRLERGN